MGQVTKEQVLEALKTVQDPDLHKDIVTLGFIKDLRICEGNVAFEIHLTTPACPVKDLLQKEAQDKVKALSGVDQVTVTMKAEVRASQVLNKNALKNVRNIIAIGSGKGGVGKSTVSVNLACALSKEGARVGLLDADIYGPSIPIMMGKQGEPMIRENLIQPKIAHGIKFMSMGFFAQGDQPLIWRGPMAHRALEQSLVDVEWGELDYLVVDLPPGTGDVHLTLVQTVSLAGAVIVSTPQDVGLMISMKTLRMLQQTNVKLLGIIENMSYHLCSHCGSREEIFGYGGVKAASKNLGIPFLGEIPLETSIREQADKGNPIVLAKPESPAAKIYLEIARNLAAQISIANFTSKKLEIVEEPA
ncbi:MAG: Mrp/NBP35 family ATP-binding protein [Elusimicrobia bacterium]|nr:Mrp/NBP35 family ATP-binding protein [Elusimicrobiota bacterium]